MNYKHQICVALIGLGLWVPVRGEQPQKAIGFCDGEIASESTIGRDDAGTVEAATFLPANMFSQWENVRILGVNAGLVSRLNTENLTVWVREALDGPNLFEASSNGRPAKGWNTFTGQEVQLPDNTGVYVGYTLETKGASYAVSAVGDDRENGLWLNTDGTWSDASTSGFGSLSAELIITASNLPSWDLSLEKVDMPGRVKCGDTLEFSIDVKNRGALTISGFTVNVEMEGIEPASFPVSASLVPGESGNYKFDLPINVTEQIPGANVTVSLSDPVEGQDVDSSNNEWSGKVNVVKFDYVRKVLVEEFTTERCSYCPDAAKDLHAVLEMDKYKDSIVAIAHHSGYQTDYFTTDADQYYLWFYNSDSSFAPAFMYDRYPFTSTSPVCRKDNGSTSDITGAVDRRLAAPVNVMLQVSAKYENGEILVHTTGAKDIDNSKLRITVVVVENDIPAIAQTNAEGDFIHQHVMRSCNAVWGELIDWKENNEFEYDCTLPVEGKWDINNLEVIAFISNYDTSNPCNCVVENAANCKLENSGASVEDLNAEECEILNVEYFNIQGMPVSAETPGLKIVKTTTSQGSHVEKLFVR